MSLVAASNLRQDDLRQMASQYQEKIDALRDAHHRELAAAESKRIDATMLAESRRVDAILSAQSSNVSLASEKSTAQATTLASQSSTLRDALESRIKVLEQNQYQSGGAKAQQSEGTKNIQWLTTLIVGVVMSMIGIGITILFFILRTTH
jgi:phage-related minor tail protein